MAHENPKMLVETHRKVLKTLNQVYTTSLYREEYRKSIWPSLCLLVVLGSQGIVVRSIEIH